MRRPVGVTIVAIVQLFYSGFGLVTGLAILLIKPVRDSIVEAAIQTATSNSQLQTTQAPPEFIHGALMIVAAIGVLFSLIGLLVGYGLLKLKGWARTWMLIFQILQVLAILPGIFAIGASSSAAGTIGAQQIFQLIISGVIIYYLSRQDVKRAFSR